MDTALYFPYMRVPQSGWFTRVLLYWEQSATIVPRSMHSRNEYVDQYMRDLAEAKLLRLLPPWPSGNVHSGDFARTFLSLVDARESNAPGATARIHTAKMSYQLFRALEKRGLARDCGDVEWWEVETGTANLFMAYLASVMSAAEPGMLPVTDLPVAIDTLTGRRDSRSQLAAFRYEVVMEALPAPSAPVALSELVDFKEKNAQRLQRCRRFLDGKLAELAAIEDDYVREIRRAALMQEIEDEVANLKEQMTKRNWPRVVLVGVGGVVASGLAGAAALAAGGTPLAVGLGVAAGIAPLPGAAHSLGELVRRPQKTDRAPLAYAVLAGQL
jgi:hypothetical protein